MKEKNHIFGKTSLPKKSNGLFQKKFLSSISQNYYIDYIKKLETELEKEKKKRKYYQKLYKEHAKKNKDLYLRVLSHSISSKNEEDDIDSIHDIDISKELMNNINSVSNKSSKKSLKKN